MAEITHLALLEAIKDSKIDVVIMIFLRRTGMKVSDVVAPRA